MLIRTALALLLLFPAAAAAQDLDTAVSAVVRISGTRGGTPVRGSGFVVGLDRDKATIVTASHVIEGAQQLEVTFAADRAESFPAGVVLGMEAGNPRGLAVFQVRGALPVGITTLSFETEVQLQRGEDLYLLGFPQMATAPLARRGTFAGPDGNFLQLDLTGGEGFSGAPVVRRSGAVVGVVTGEDPQLTFAVKALVARDAVIGWGGKVGSSAGTSAKIPPLWPDPKMCVPGQKRLQNGIVFIRICPGTFTMGSAENDPLASPDEKPAHQVKLREFWIGKTEITNEQYRRFLPYHQGEANLPSVNISWANAKAACEHFGGRLPTEAEWEYAARAGTQTPWSFGDDEQMLTDYAWHDKNSGDMVHPVGIKKPNAWGLHDMYGNVWEWVADWYGTYLGVAQTDPSGPTTGEYYVMRGGAFAFSAKLLRSAFRGMDVPFYRFGSTGFRCALSQAPPPKEPVKVDFKVGSARLLNIAKPQLDLVALQMQEDRTLQAQIIAHNTAGGSANSAQRLSDQRIQAVKSYLAVRHGIDPEHIRTEDRWAADSIDNAVADHPLVVVIIIGEFSS